MNHASSAVKVLVAVILIASCRGVADESSLYGSVPAVRHLTGRFDPAKHELFVCLNDVGIPTNNRRHYVRREAAAALKDLYTAFRKEHPTIPFWVQSSFRGFDDQKYIWDGKWTGTIEVAGHRLNTIRDPRKRALEILKYSAMPGTSRHHWGADFDINVLNNNYFETGEGRVLYRWLTANAGRYGFCQPYTAGRSGGYSVEKWHWSYAPLAKKFLAGWNAHYRKSPGDFSREGLFCGSDLTGDLAPVYVNSIDAACE
ncbi:MAG: hypothetical protein A2176_07900 [Spirochaetes bacterium RBG_13_51_14]|nr:MAG: hypothetical protein A2176_07900 [Spirochaetes bacterium RBG_13_51_14]